MQKIIGRSSEKKQLKAALSANQSSLIALYGRRRVGKTFLVRHVYAKYIQFELTGLHGGSLSDQLFNFHQSLQAKGFEASCPTRWLEAFYQLQQFLDQLKTRKKKVVFIDEFPWLATRRSKFLMAFENFWNSYASKRDDLVVVICGSAAAYMVKKIIRNKGGLHNRITHKIRLMPFNLKETRQFLKSRKINYTKYDILQIYMAIGGIPHYLERLKRGESVSQAIDRLCFSKDAPLRTEFMDIFASLFKNHQRHEAIIRALGVVRKGLSRTQLLMVSRLPTGGRLTDTLAELEESGFIIKYLTYKHKKNDALYRLNDEYAMFYLKFIEKSAATEAGAWITKFNTPAYQSWSGFSYETICLKHIDQIKSALGISAIYSENYSWAEKGVYKGAQIDLLIDRADRVINLCEVKFSSRKFSLTKAHANELNHKASVFQAATKSRKNVFVTMITTYGIRQNQYSLEMVQNELTMDDLFRF